MRERVFDKIIVGAGIAGLSAAYELLEAGRAAGKPFRLAVLAEEVFAPSAFGTSIVLGLDGFDEGELPAEHGELCALVRSGLERLAGVARDERIDCRLDLYLQLIAPDRDENEKVIGHAVSRLGYRRDEIVLVEEPSNRLRFTGFPDVWETRTVGQVNGPLFLTGLAAAVRRRGGEIVLGATYLNHASTGSVIEVRTTAGNFQTSAPPLLAGGPHLMSRIPGMPVSVTPVYTMAMHVPLVSEDAAKVCNRPVAYFCPSHDWLWGSLDSCNVLTIGVGLTDDVSRGPEHEARLRETFASVLPHLTTDYGEAISFSFNAMAWTQNMYPVVGRMKDFDVITGNCGRGFAQSFAEAKAYAYWVIHGDDRTLRLFEKLNLTI